jgi:hypothetical protein
MKIGDWVYFKTRNWPKDSVPDEAERDSDEGLYTGRGKIVGIAGDNVTVREEMTDFLVEVGLHPDDQLLPLDFDYATLTLGDLRQFLDQHKDIPEDTPVTIALPLSFFSDLDEMPPDHPEYNAVSEWQSVEACGISITGFTEDGDFTDSYIPPAERAEVDWNFSVEITPHPEQCFEALRTTEDE